MDAAVLERRFVRRYLGRPSLLLLGVREGPKWFRRIYPEFYEALPNTTIDKILAKARAQGITEPGEALFWLAYDNIRQKKALHARVSTFLNLYGLCRNLSMTALLVCAMLIVSALYWQKPMDYWWATASASSSCGSATSRWTSESILLGSILVAKATTFGFFRAIGPSISWPSRTRAAEM